MSKRQHEGIDDASRVLDVLYRLIPKTVRQVIEQYMQVALRHRIPLIDVGELSTLAAYLRKKGTLDSMSRHLLHEAIPHDLTAVFHALVVLSESLRAGAEARPIPEAPEDVVLFALAALA